MSRHKILLILGATVFLCLAGLMVAQQYYRYLLTMPNQKQKLGMLTHVPQGKTIFKSKISGRWRIRFEPDSLREKSATNHVVCRLTNLGASRLTCVFDLEPPDSQHQEWLEPDSSVVIFEGSLGKMLGMKSPLISTFANSGEISLTFDFSHEALLVPEVSVHLLEEKMMP
ncbi:MAG: hypothetical protein JWR69_1363 [Pedosphaera sp.]|nr:hypothetical protein [Pedosphaera sp.]